MVAEGADVIDVGGESTRPGAYPVPADEELRRVLATLGPLRARVQSPISVDTSKAGVARAALEEGADLINDVTAGRGDPDMLDVVARADVPIVLMHMRGIPATMQECPEYPGDDVLAAVLAFLRERIEVARFHGIGAEKIIVDPGIGFGKTTRHNLTLFDRPDALASPGHPVLTGPSRKRFIGEIAGGAPEDRLEGTAAAVALAVYRGAALVRVHDVAPMVKVVRMAEAFRQVTRDSGSAAAGAR